MSDMRADAKAIFLKALDFPGPHDLSRFLDEACGNDALLRDRVEELLRANQEAGGFLGGASVRQQTTDVQLAERPGTVIGPYKLLEIIGEGGFGVVYMAEQSEPIRRKVAVKVLKPGMDTRQVVARFESERQALALMDHPHIARVFDGGQTASGRPYFVMELVRGTPINEYCDQQHLPITQRIELFIHVCQAVQHAHQKGIIHRDLKPSNVLIASNDGVPMVKVIDFGIAKAITGPLTDKTLFTGFAQMIGTPLYMSPEQAGQSSLDVDTRSDIYSLGVLLYELLTGATPFDGDALKQAGFDEMRRIIREDEPPRPSTRLSTMGQTATTASTKRRSDPRRLSQLLRGDLDWIVMKALEKDRNRRYETPNAFVLDLQRFLADEPVAAGPPSISYRMQKFLKRNRGAAVATVVVLLALIGGIIGTTWGMLEAREAERFASKETLEKTKALTKAIDAETDMRAALLEREEVLGIYSVALAAREWDTGQPTRADYALEVCPLEKRSWEWHHLKGLCNNDVRRVRFADPGSWLGAAGTFSPDGSLFAAPLRAHALGAWRFWETKTGNQVAVFNKIVGGKIAISPDNKTFAYASSFGVAIHDFEGKEQLRLAKAFGYLSLNALFASEIIYSPDGKRVFLSYMVAPSGDASKVNAASMPPSIHDAASGKLLARCDPGPNTLSGLLAFSGNGSQVAFECRDFTENKKVAVNRIKIADSTNGKDVWTLSGHAEKICSLVFSADGKYLASAGFDRVVKIWDMSNGKLFKTIEGLEGIANVLRFTTDGKLLASANSDKTVRLWEVNTGREILVQRGHDHEVNALYVHADGNEMTSAGGEATLRTWLVRPSQNPLIFPEKANFIVFSPKGDRFATIRMLGDPKRPLGAEIRIWDAARFQEILRREIPAVTHVDLRFESDKCLAMVKKTILEVIDVETGELAQTFRLLGNMQSFSKDWRFMVGRGGMKAGKEGRAQTTYTLVDLVQGKVSLTLGHFEGESQTFFHSDCKRLIVAPDKETPRVVDTADGKELLRLQGSSTHFRTVAFSLDGDFVAGGANFKNRLGEIRVWDLRTGKTVAFMDGHPEGITSLAFNRDGTRLASASADKTVKIWDTRAGLELLTIRGHAHAVQHVAFSPNGRFLVSTDGSGVTKFWDGQPWQETPGRVIDAPGGSGPQRSAGFLGTKLLGPRNLLTPRAGPLKERP